MTQRIQEPESPYQMETLSPDERNLLVAQRRYDLAMADLAHAALMLGDLETAQHCGERSSMKELVETVQAAVARDDGERCDCPPPKYLDVGGVPFYSDKHNGYVKLYRCHLCGDTNALSEHPDATSSIASI